VISKDLDIAIDNAINRAREGRHAGITVEHLLLQLVELSTVQEHLRSRGIDGNALRADLEGCVSQTEAVSESEYEDTPPTLAFQTAIQYAVLRAREARRQEVTPIDVLDTIVAHSENLALNPTVKRRIASIKRVRSNHVFNRTR
jgi:ATP-dependent Clp protease ATP-binding subunit ClpA